jgi:exodeoxyribonuclease III
MKLISWNVNGIRAVQKKGFVDFVIREDPDLLCLQETKANKDQLEPILHTPHSDYDSYWSSASRKGYSGVVTYSKVKPLKVEHGIGIEKFDSEGRFIITHFEKFVLYNVYFPNGSSRQERHDFKMEFLKVFGKLLSEQVKKGKKVILVGDYNIAHREIDVYDPVRLSKVSGFLPEEREWFDDFLKSGFIDTFREKHPTLKDKYSWWSYRELARPANRGWRIDYICVSENLKSSIGEASIMDEQEGSDHCPVVLKLK